MRYVCSQGNVAETNRLISTFNRPLAAGEFQILFGGFEQVGRNHIADDGEPLMVELALRLARQRLCSPTLDGRIARRRLPLGLPLGGARQGPGEQVGD